MTISTINANTTCHNRGTNAPFRFGSLQVRRFRRLRAALLAPLGMILVAGLAGLGGCAPQSPAVDEAGVRQPYAEPERGLPQRLATADSQVVDCQLPPMIHRLGIKLVYLGSPRKIRTTARDCAVRGGGFIASDPANSTT